MQSLRSLCLLLGLAGVSLCATAGVVKISVRDAHGSPVPNAAVFLESADAKAAVRPASGLEIAQQDKRFTPTVTVVPLGSPVSFPNRDTVRHHVYSFSPAKTFEIKLYAGKPANPVVFDRPGIAVLGCNIHDQMTGWVVVVETPYFSTTGAAGAVDLTGVPPGSYRLRTWAPQLPPGAPALDQPITIGAEPFQATVQLSRGSP